MKIKSCILRAAMVCQGKKEFRYFLNGIHISDKYVESSNGHIAVRMEHGLTHRGDLIISISGSIPVGAQETEIVLEDVPMMIHRDEQFQVVSISPIEVIDGPPLGLQKIFSALIEKPAGSICMDGQYLHLPIKMFRPGKRQLCQKLRLHGPNNAIVIEFDGMIKEEYGDPKFLIMPVSDRF